MQVGNKLFPYPTINNYKIINCFKESTYELEYEEQLIDDKLILKNAHINLNNTGLLNLIKEGKAEAVIIVECSSTIYRRSYIVDWEGKDIEILLSDLKDKVVISSFVYAKEEINAYNNEDFLDDYEGYQFNIEKYDILAIDDGKTTKIEYNEQADRKVSSIFSIIKDKERENMKVALNSRKIIIYLPEKQFDFYDNMKMNDNFQNIFFSMIAIPSLAQALNEILRKVQNQQIDFEDIDMNYSWFTSIKAAFEKKYESKLNEEKFLELEMLELAQSLLNNGTVNGIEDLFNIVLNRTLEGGFEDE